MKKSPRYRANSVLNLVHKGVVLTCMGVTLYGTAILGYRFIRYMTVTRPEFMEQKKLLDRQLLEEGSSENVKDMAPNIS